MFWFMLRRISLVVPVVIVVSILTFVAGHIAPGGPFDRAGMGRELPPQVIENLNRKFHLDEPAWKQYLIYMANFVQGDLGPSYQFKGQSVSELVFSSPDQPFWSSRFGKTFELGTFAFLIACTIGIPLGVISAVRQNSWLDRVALLGATVGVALPNYVVALILMIVFGVQLGWLPIITADYADWRAWVLPSITLSLPLLALLARLARASMLEALRQDYIRTARAKGLREGAVIYRHALRTSLIPVATVLGPALAALVTGSFVIEYMFSFPGMGSFFITGVYSRDYSMVMGLTLFYAVLITIATLLVDLAYVWLDPRIQVS